MKKRMFTGILMLFLTHFAMGQKSISGVVSDAAGEVLPGATIVIENTNRGTTSDFDGAFQLKANKGDTMVISMVGFTSKKITVSDANQYQISLEEDNQVLEELVIVGYGEQKKINLTGAVETVSFKEEVNQPVTNSGQLLYGRFSGVQLTQSSGSPGADGSSVVIRGIGTFGNTTPLIVIDGIQYSDMAAFNNLAPADIESVSVLKDASAAAIYGARGANGVIVVNTRRGEEGTSKVSYNSYYGIQSVTIKPEFLNASDYARLMNEKFINQNGANADLRYTPEQLEAINNGTLPDQFANTNWADEVLQTASVSNHNLSFSGGNKKNTYRASFGYLGQNAVVKSKFKSERYNFSLNINSELKDWISFNTVNNIFWRKNQGPAGGQNAFSGDNGIIYSFQRAAPTIPLYLSNGSYGFVDGAFYNDNPSKQTQNPLRRGFLGNFESDAINISHRSAFNLTFSDHLSFEASGSANVIYNNTSNFSPTTEMVDWNGDNIGGSDQNSLSNSTNFQYRLLQENILKYKRSINDVHHFNLLLGHSISYFKTDGFSGSLAGFPTDNLEEFNGGGVTDPAVSGSASEQSYQSFFGRINYNYDGKYLAEFNLRRDGSSKFNSANRYGTFPSASLGWNISKESFMEDVDIINNLKLRASWGISGNDRIGNYIFEQTYNPGLDYLLGDGTIVSGVAITSLANPSIRWEETEQYDIGLDLSLLQNKIEIVADYFKRSSSDILYGNFPIPNTIGVTNLAAQNAASMENSGLELGINYRDNINDVKFSVGGNMTHLINNEVTGLGDGGEETITNTNIISIGNPFRAYYGYKAIGIFQSFDEIANSPTQFGNTNTAPGDIKYADINGDGSVNQDDRTVIGNPNPKLLLNFNGSVEFKNFDLNFLFQGVSGVDRLLMGNGNLPMQDDRSNALTYWLNRWTPENPSTNLPRLGGQNNNLVSTFYIQDASYLRLKNLELGYSIPENILKNGIEKLRIFVGAQNLLTFTGLENFDPERGNGNQSNRGAPLYKTITLGINVKL